jgi:O-6-methylguanine DNA methyltransferase
MISFRGKVLEVVRNIPKGKTLSYKEVAKRAGHALAARAVGSFMAHNHDPKVPCHRVIKSDGTLGGYNGGIKKKIALLRKEGAIK